MSPDAPRLSTLVLRYLASAAQGRADLDELCRDCPQLRSHLEVCLLVLGHRPAGGPLTPAAPPAGQATSDLQPGVPPPAEPWPSVPGYEVLSRLGQGGMGVVYRARQVKLDRVVALKMVLHAGLADPG